MGNPTHVIPTTRGETAADDDLAMITTYFWNVDLCQSLYPSLGAVEVSMRNGIHDALTAYFGAATWYDMPQLLLPRELDQVTDAKRKIRRARKTVIPPHVVAALDFGFWTRLLDAGYGTTSGARRIRPCSSSKHFPMRRSTFKCAVADIDASTPSGSYANGSSMTSRSGQVFRCQTARRASLVTFTSTSLTLSVGWTQPCGPLSRPSIASPTPTGTAV